MWTKYKSKTLSIFSCLMLKIRYRNDWHSSIINFHIQDLEKLKSETNQPSIPLLSIFLQISIFKSGPIITHHFEWLVCITKELIMKYVLSFYSKEKSQSQWQFRDSISDKNVITCKCQNYMKLSILNFVRTNS